MGRNAGGVLAGIVAVAVGLALAAVLVPFNVKRRHIIKAARSASDEQLDAIYRLVDTLAPEKASAGVLAFTNRRVTNDTNIIHIPSWLDRCPWSEKTIVIDVTPKPIARLIYEPVVESQFAGKAFRAVKVPRTTSRTGKAKNLFSPKRYLTGNAELRAALAAVCPRHPESLLAFLLCSARESFEFDPINQARIGGSPAWIQNPDPPTCAACAKKLRFIAQVPGPLLSAERLSNSTFYVFGCVMHQDTLEMVEQFT